MEETKRTDVSSERIIKKYIDMVYRLALSQTKSKPDADDIVQTVFLKYLQSGKTFESDEHIKAWLLRVTINCVKKHFTASWFKKTVPLSELPELSFETPEQSEAYEAVLSLPAKYRAVIHLFYYEDMSIKEIARATGSNEGTIKSQLSRARDMLRQKLKGGGNYV